MGYVSGNSLIIYTMCCFAHQRGIPRIDPFAHSAELVVVGAGLGSNIVVDVVAALVQPGRRESDGRKRALDGRWRLFSAAR